MYYMIANLMLNIGDLGPLYLTPLWEIIWQGLTDSQALVSAIPLGIAAYFAFPYLRRRTYEEIQRRYINRIEGLIDYFHLISAVLEKNHARTLGNLRLFRELDFPVFKEWYTRKQFVFEEIGPQMTADFRVALDLIDSRKIANLCIDNFTTCYAVNEVYATEIPIRISEALDGDTSQFGNPQAREEISKGMANRLNEQRTKLERIHLYTIPGQLEEILKAARRLKIDDYDKLERLSKDPQVIQAIQIMEKWADELSTEEE